MSPYFAVRFVIRASAAVLMAVSIVGQFSHYIIAHQINPLLSIPLMIFAGVVAAIIWEEIDPFQKR